MSGQRPRAVLSRTWRIGRINRVELRLSPTLILAAVVLIGLFAPRLDALGGSAPGDSGYVRATGFVLALVLSVLLHELAHFAAARLYGMEVEAITLHAMGGQTSIRGDSQTPGQEFWISAAGPMATFALSALAWLIATSGSGEIAIMASLLMTVNILIGLLNLLPAFPLDGGRVFGSVVWLISGHRATGSLWTSWTGRVLAVSAVIAPGLVLLSPERSSFHRVDLLLAVLIAVFLWNGASAGFAQARHQRGLQNVDARLLAEPAMPGDAELPVLHQELSGDSLLSAMAAEPAGRYALRDRDGALVGALRSDSVARAYREGAS